MRPEGSDQREVRDATAADAAGCAEVYAPYVRETATSFETEPPSADELAARIAAAQIGHAWLVLVEGGTVLGYAYAGPLRARAAYGWASEVSVYLRADQRGRGDGRRLYEALLTRLRERGYTAALACTTLPNEASDRLHRGLGFRLAGIWTRVGWKLDAWHDVAWYQLDLDPEQGAGPSAPPGTTG